MCPGLAETRKEVVFGLRIPDIREASGCSHQRYQYPGSRLGTQQCVHVQHHDPERTVLGKKFLSLPGECDSLEHAVSHIKHAQRLSARRTAGLWKQAKGINDDIVVKTARFIVNMTVKEAAGSCEVRKRIFQATASAGARQGSSTTAT